MVPTKYAVVFAFLNWSAGWQLPYRQAFDLKPKTADELYARCIEMEQALSIKLGGRLAGRRTFTILGSADRMPDRRAKPTARPGERPPR